MLCLALLILPPAAPAASVGDLDQLRRHALELVNRARQEEGLSALELGSRANAAAQAHAEDMATRGYYAHTSPAGETARDRYLKAGGSAAWLTAENIARCKGCVPPPIGASVQSLHEDWLASPLHRQNVLHRGVSEFGFGIAVTAEGGLYAVQVFAGPGLPVGLQAGEPTTALAAASQPGRALDHLNRLRREAGLAPLAHSPDLSAAAAALLPDPAADRLDFGRGARLYGALPEGDRARWRSLAVLGAGCSGCGITPTEADIREFLQQWQNDDRHRATMLGTGLTHLGFAMAVDGEGRKVAVAVFGNR